MKLFAVTGFGQPEDRQKALDAGFDAHLVKPLEYESLISIIRSASDGAGRSSAGIDGHDGHPYDGRDGER
jgi:CheY-like chemotaxis protein